jgi:protein SCO1/2
MRKKLFFIYLFSIISFSTHPAEIHQNFHIQLKDFPQGGEFSLDCLKGKCSLSDYHGKVVILFFGYLSCPDICPSTLHQLQLTMKKLERHELDRIQILFVTLDQLRDTPKALDSYLSSFNIPVIGLSGEKDEIDKLVEQYAGQYKKVAYQNSALGYGIDHSAAIYLIDTSGKLRTLLRHETPPHFLALSLRSLLGER